jgi:hypothetical protein
MTRAGAAVAVVVSVALLPAAGVLVQVVGNPRTLTPRDDPVSAFERRVAPLRAALRGERGVGYLAPEQAPNRVAHLYSLRYTLAPIQVFDDVQRALVVADGVADTRRLPPDLRVRRDFGDGLLLLERVQP